MPQSAASFDVPMKLNVEKADLTDEQFVQLCHENRDLRLELFVLSGFWLLRLRTRPPRRCGNELAAFLGEKGGVLGKMMDRRARSSGPFTRSAFKSSAGTQRLWATLNDLPSTTAAIRSR